MIVAGLLLMVLALWIVLLLNIEAYARIRWLGYFAPTAAFLAFGLDAVAVVAVIGIIVLLPRDYWDNGPLIFGIGILTLVAFGSAVLVRKLPKRRDSTRMFGPRSPPQLNFTHGGQYSIELFRDGGEGAGIEKIIVRHDSLTVSRALYKAAVLNIPERLIMLCDKARVLTRSDRPETMPEIRNAVPASRGR